jgi:hypothetical protein
MPQRKQDTQLIDILRQTVWGLKEQNEELLYALERLVERDRSEAAESGFSDDEMTWLEDARRVIAKVKGGAA